MILFYHSRIQNGSFEDNVLFGQPVKKDLYENVLQACALYPDLKRLPVGDKTEIGFSGINLSGGQKQRIALARAAYKEARLVLLDSPLSCVDTQVGKHLFDNVIGPKGILKNTTRLFVTHNVDYLSQCDSIIVLKDGKICFHSTYDDFSKTNGLFHNSWMENIRDVENNCNLSADRNMHQQSNSIDIRLQLGEGVENGIDHVIPKNITENHNNTHAIDSFSCENDNNSLSSTMVEGTEDSRPVNICSNIITEEEIEKGQVSIDTYKHYLKSFGILSTILVIIGAILSEGSSIGSDYWLNIWSDGILGNPREDKYRNVYLTGYGLFGIVMAVLNGFSAIFFAVVSLKASSYMHHKMLNSMLKSPILFFDSTPLGRIMNRFASDISLCDSTLPDSIYELLCLCLDFVGTITVILTVIPIFAVVIVPGCIIFLVVGWLYVRTARQLRRIVSNSRSPIYSHFVESLAGCSTIRAFNMEESFVGECEKRIDFNHKCSYPSMMANRWLEFVCQTIGSFITLVVSIFAVTWVESVQPGEVGLIITNAMMINFALPNLVTSVTSVETNIIAVERIKRYSNLDQEGATNEDPSSEPQNEWPEHGEVTFVDYSAKYRLGLDLVLHGINCTIKGGEKLCIVGRTGAGKSSVAMAIFRLFEASMGKICIDKTDIAKIDLARLRKSITIIPQDPTLFSGTIRMNLDPSNEYTDAEIWKALKTSHLEAFVKSLDNGILHIIFQGGDNFSVGQRQLLCLARAILQKNKILILDEATASVDIGTDRLIQETVAEEFKNNTVISITHRIDTILDCDRVMVLDEGKIAELGAINDLMKSENSIFHSIIKDNIQERDLCSTKIIKDKTSV